MSDETDKLIDMVCELMGKIYKDQARQEWRIEYFDSDQRAALWKALMACREEPITPPDNADEGDMGGSKP